MRSNKGFTLLEIVVAVFLVGILATLAVRNLSAAKSSSEEQSMRQKAVELNNYMGEYITSQSVRRAVTKWSGKSNDERYQLLRPFMQFSNETLDKYVLDGYSVTFPDDPRQQVTLSGPDGVISYQQ